MGWSPDGPVLLVDDAAEVRRLFARALRASAVEVVEAEDVSGAFETLRTRSIGVVLCDARLGEEQGSDLLALVREQPSLEDVPLVLWSGEHRDDEGFDAYALKGGRLGPLVELVLRWRTSGRQHRRAR